MLGSAPRSSSALTTASCSTPKVQRRPQPGVAGERAALVDEVGMGVEERGDRAASPLLAAASRAVSGERGGAGVAVRRASL